MTSLKSVRKRRQQLHARDVGGLVAFCFCPLEENIVNKSCVPPFWGCKLSRPDKYAELLKIYFKSLVKMLKFSSSVAKSDLRFKFHLKWEKNNPS